jgi:hypothetical protein
MRVERTRESAKKDIHFYYSIMIMLYQLERLNSEWFIYIHIENQRKYVVTIGHKGRKQRLFNWGSRLSTVTVYRSEKCSAAVACSSRSTLYSNRFMHTCSGYSSALMLRISTVQPLMTPAQTFRPQNLTTEKRFNHMTLSLKSGRIVRPTKIVTLRPQKVGHSVTVEHYDPL